MASWCSIACACSVAILLSGCTKKVLPDYGIVPEFRLTAQDGREFDSRDLQGKVWVADFIFTNCPGPCPRMTSQMRSVEKAYAGEPDLKLVSFTVDPLRDTPDVLKSYAEKFHFDPAQWTFLTGSVPILNDLSRKVFLLGNVDGKTFEHSTRFILIDRQGHIRGNYLTSEPESIPNLTSDIKILLKEKS
jgi:protein SCO1